MPDNISLPSPNQILGTNKASRLPSPEESLSFKSPQLREGDTNVVLPKYKTPQDLAVDNSIELLKQKGGRNGTTVMDSEWDVLKDVLKDPRATKDQREKAILTIQGYGQKHDDNNTMYYNKLEDNGVYVPTALAYGEKPPKGYKVASVWGNQKEADDDSWYTDLGKSLGNGVLGAAQGAINLAQVGTTMATGEENKYLNKLSNTAEALKFKKDSELETPILNTEGVEKWSDLLDKDRFDLSPKALWGAFNTAAESLTSFAGGVVGARQIFTNSPKAAIFTGSFATQLGDNLDNAEEAGLKGRDKAAVASAITAPMAALDVFWGLDGKLMSQLFRNEKKELLKNVIKGVEKDAAGNITEQGFKQLAKQMTVGYTELAKKGTKEIVKDVLSEGGQEAAQDFSQKAGEQLWDKLTPDERGQFGTDAFSAKAFGDYINSFATGLVAGVPMAVGTQVLRNKHDEQSINAYERVKQGPEAVTALKTDLGQALKNNDINQSEYDQAIFKIDSYDKYHQETKDINLKPEDEKKVFELSFQIQGLKTEIPTNENEISKLEPINRAKVESKQKQVKELQSELNDIIRQGEIKGEPVIPKKEEERIQKEKEKEIKAKESLKEEENNSKLNQKVVEKPTPKEKVKTVKSDYKPIHSTLDKRNYEDVSADEFNENKFPTRTKHRMARKYIYNQLNHKVDAKMTAHPYTYDGEVHYTYKGTMPDGKELKFSSSMIRPEGFRGHMRTERLKGNAEGLPITFKSVDLGKIPEGYKAPEGYNSKKKAIMIYQKSDGKFLGWAKETHKGAADALDKEGNALYSEAEKDLMAHLETIDETPATEQEMESARQPLPKPTPTERAKEATNKIVEEAKVKVKEQKASVPLTITKVVRQQLYDLNFSKANVDNMKPERALEIINKQEVKPKENGKQESAVDGKKSIGGNNEETSGEDKGSVKETKLKGSKSRIQRKVKEPNRLKASKITVDNAYDLVMQHFIGGGYIDRDSLKSFFKGKESEAFARQNLTLKLDKYNARYAPNMKDLAHSLWEEHQEQYPQFNTEDYYNALESVLLENTSPIQMAKDLIKKTETPTVNRQEELLAGIYEDKEVDENKADAVIDYLETLSTEKLQELADKDKWDQGTDIVINNEEDPFQKESTTPSVYAQRVIDKLQKALPKVKIVFDTNLKAAGKWSPSTNTITINPEYAGKDTAIHEAGHILIDAMGYNNKVIQQAIKQLRDTDLYKETKERYPELNEEQLDKEVLAEAIGREGANIFDKVEDRSKFNAYLDYIFDWLKQKLGLDKNVAKSLAKQIIGGIKTKDLKGVETGKEQLQKVKTPVKLKSLSFQQYAAENGFSYEKETDKMDEAKVNLTEATEAMDEAEINGTEEEYKTAEKEYVAAKKAYAIAGKKTFEYKKYKKDFKEVQSILEDKDLEDYTDEELNNLIVKLFSFNDKAAKNVKERAYQKLGHRVTVKQQEISKGKEGVIESLAKTSDIGPLQAKILHHSHFSEKNADMQAVSLAYSTAIIDKLSEANSLKDTHAKLGLKVINEENKRLGITGSAANRFSSDSSKYFDWMINKDGEYLTVEEAQAKGLSQAKINYLKFHREVVNSYRNEMAANDFENVKMGAIRVDKNFREAYKSEGLIPAFSYYLGGGATNLGRVRILHNGKIMSYSEIEKEIIANVDKKNIKSIAKALFDLLVANIKARYQLKKGQNIDEKDNPLELKGDAEYSLNEKGQLVSKFDKPRSPDRGYSKDFYKAMNQFIDESAHVKHISKIMPLVEAVEYLNKHGYMEEGYIPKKNVSKWMEDWKALHIFKEPHVNDPIIDAAVKSLRKLVASTTMWFNIPANAINVFMGNYNNWRAENAETLVRGNARLFGGKGSRKEVGVVNDYALAIIKKYNLVNQDFDSHPVIKANSIFSKLATWGTQVGEYQIQGSLGLGLLSKEEYDSFEFTKDKYGNDVLTVKDGVDEAKLKAKMTQVKNRVTDIQGKYPDEDRRNIMRGEFGKALFQFKVWMPDWFKERFSARYINAYGQEKEGSYTKLLRVGLKEMKDDLKKGDIKKALTNHAFVTNLKGIATIGALLALKHSDDDDDDKKKGGLNWDSVLSQVLFIFDLEQDKYMVSNPAAVLGKIKDMLNAFESLIGFEEDAWQKTKRILPGNKAITFAENQIK